MTVTANRLLLFISAACFLIAALVVALGLPVGPDWAWGFGGFSAWVLAAALP